MRTLLLAFLIIFSPSIAHAMEAESVIDCTNQIRAEHGLDALVGSELLKEAAEAKLDDMENYQYFAHKNPVTLEYLWPTIARIGYRFRLAGENLARGFDSEQAVCDAWEASPSHLKNIVRSEYRDIGVATRYIRMGRGRGHWFTVEVFGDPNF